MTGDGVEWNPQFGGHMGDKASFSTAGRPFDQYGELVVEGVFEQLHLISVRLVVG